MRFPSALPLLVGLSLAGVPATAAPPEGKPPSVEALRASETKALLPLLRAAAKEDYRRQAWYVATRVLSADPGNAEAQAVVRRWTPVDLEGGRDPAPAWLSARDALFRRIGDEYAQHVRLAQAADAAATDTFALLERAFAYGTQAADALAAMSDAGFAWRGTYGSVKKGLVERALGTFASSVSFPPEHDDGVLRYRSIWRDVRVVEFGRTRLLSALSPEETWHAVAILSAEEASFVRTFGSREKAAKDGIDRTDIVLAPDEPTFTTLGEAFVDPANATEFTASSSWWMPSRRRLLVLAKPRDNPWVAADAHLLGQAVRPLLARHLGAGSSGWISGRGAWLLDGFVGAFEGFVAKGQDDGDVEPDRVGRLAIARELHDRAGLLPWREFLEMDRREATAHPRRDVPIVLGGQKVDARQISVPEAQATVVVLGIWRSDPVKGPKRLAALVDELYKRDRLPDLDKVCGTAPGKMLEAIQRFLAAK